jgi:flagellar motor switch protein FliM
MSDGRRKLTRTERRIVAELLDRLSEKFPLYNNGFNWENLLVEASECFKGVRFYVRPDGMHGSKLNRQ